MPCVRTANVKVEFTTPRAKDNQLLKLWHSIGCYTAHWPTQCCALTFSFADYCLRCGMRGVCVCTHTVFSISASKETKNFRMHFVHFRHFNAAAVSASPRSKEEVCVRKKHFRLLRFCEFYMLERRLLTISAIQCSTRVGNRLQRNFCRDLRWKCVQSFTYRAKMEDFNPVLSQGA